MDINVKINPKHFFQAVVGKLITSWHERDQPPAACCFIHCGKEFEEYDVYTVIEIEDENSGKVAFVHGDCAIRIMDLIIESI